MSESAQRMSSADEKAGSGRTRQRGAGPAPGAALWAVDTEQMRGKIQGNLDQMKHLLAEMKKCNARMRKKQDTDQSRKQLCVRAKVADLRSASLWGSRAAAAACWCPMRRQEAQEQSQTLREETMHLFKKFRAAGGSKAQQDRLIRDFQAINRQVVEVTKATGTNLRPNCPFQSPRLTRRRLWRLSLQRIL